MSSEQLYKILGMIKAAYGGKFQQIDNEVLEMWFECLQPYDYDRMRKATILFSQHSKFPPTIADLIDEYNKIDEKKGEWQ